MVECLLLSLAAGVLGLVIGWWALQATAAHVAAGPAGVSDASLDWRVVAFTALVSVVTGLVFGAAPALHTRAAARRPTACVKARVASVGTRRAHRTRNVLVVVEVALAGMLLVLASLLIQTFVRLLNVNIGFQADSVLTMEVALPRAGVSGRAACGVLRAAGRAAVGGAGRQDVAADVEHAAGGHRKPAPGDDRVRERPRPEPERKSSRTIRVDHRRLFPGHGDSARRWRPAAAESVGRTVRPCCSSTR